MKTKIKVKDRYMVTVRNVEAPPPFKDWSEPGMFMSEKEARSKKIHKYAVEYRTHFNTAETVGVLKKKFKELEQQRRFTVTVEQI